VHTFYGKVIVLVDLVAWYIVSDSMHRSFDADYGLPTVYQYDMDVNEDCMKQEIRLSMNSLLSAVDMTEQQIRLYSPRFLT
jgi:RNAse (barnase) inhibitor barstar